MEANRKPQANQQIAPPYEQFDVNRFSVVPRIPAVVIPSLIRSLGTVRLFIWKTIEEPFTPSLGRQYLIAYPIREPIPQFSGNRFVFKNSD